MKLLLRAFRPLATLGTLMVPAGPARTRVKIASGDLIHSAMSSAARDQPVHRLDVRDEPESEDRALFRLARPRHSPRNSSPRDLP